MTGSIQLDETDDPFFRMRLEGIPEAEEWSARLNHMTQWARRGTPYAIAIDARKVGWLPATHRKEVADWVNRERRHLALNCAGAALVFSNAEQRGLLTAITWITDPPSPVRAFFDIPSAEVWLGKLLREASPRW